MICYLKFQSNNYSQKEGNLPRYLGNYTFKGPCVFIFVFTFFKKKNIFSKLHLNTSCREDDIGRIYIAKKTWKLDVFPVNRHVSCACIFQTPMELLILISQAFQGTFLISSNTIPTCEMGVMDSKILMYSYILITY